MSDTAASPGSAAALSGTWPERNVRRLPGVRSLPPSAVLVVHAVGVTGLVLVAQGRAGAPGSTVTRRAAG